MYETHIFNQKFVCYMYTVQPSRAEITVWKVLLIDTNTENKSSREIIKTISYICITEYFILIMAVVACSVFLKKRSSIPFFNGSTPVETNSSGA